MRVLIRLIILSLLIVNAEASSDESSCERAFNKPKGVLVSLYELSSQFAKNTCMALIEDDVRALEDINFLTGGINSGARDELLNFYSSNFPEAIFPGVVEAKRRWSEFRFPDYIQSDTYDLSAAYYINKNRFGFSGPKLVKLGRIDPDNTAANQHCRSLNYDSCQQLFKDIKRVGQIQNSYIRTNYSNQALDSIRAKRKRWDKYSDSSRFQSPLDILFTSWVYREELSDGKNLKEPPKNQYFLLHPSLVYDHFSEATSGDKSELSIAIEWAGVNKWDESIPWGISLASVYTDRAEGKSVGHGLMFHVNNSFSFGFASRGGGDNSFYVNVNVFEWFAETQNKYKSYKTSLNRF